MRHFKDGFTELLYKFVGKIFYFYLFRKRRSDLTASRGELIEVNVESAFEPIIQEYIRLQQRIFDYNEILLITVDL